MFISSVHIVPKYKYNYHNKETPYDSAQGQITSTAHMNGSSNLQ